MQRMNTKGSDRFRVRREAEVETLKQTLTCDVLHFGQAAVKSVHCLQELSAVAFSLERRQDQHLAVLFKGQRRKRKQSGWGKQRLVQN